MGTARGTATVLIKGITYNAVTEATDGKKTPPPKLARAAQAAEEVAGEAANVEILSHMGQELGVRTVSGRIVDVGSQFDALQDAAFVRAKDSVLLVFKQAKSSDWVPQAASLIGLFTEPRSLPNNPIWKHVKEETTRLSEGPIEQSAWEAAEAALASGLNKAAAAANREVARILAGPS